MPRRRRLLPLVLLPLLAPAPALAGTLPVDQDALLVREHTGQIDGIVEPGDTVDVIQTLLSSGASELQSLSGTLNAVGRTIFSPYPDVLPGQRTANTATPYRFLVPSNLDCGTRVPLTFSLRDGGGNQHTVSDVLATGVPGTPQLFERDDSLVVPANGNDVESVLTVPESVEGTTSLVRVRLDSVTHQQNVRDLRLWLESPTGAEIQLVQAVTGTTGTAFTDTWLAPDASTGLSGPAPWTGTFLVEDLEELAGMPLAGDWKLRADTTTTTGTATGLIDKWSLELSPASCEPVLRARINRTPSVGLPGQNVNLDANTLSLARGSAPVTYSWDKDNDGDWDATGPTTTVTRATSGFVPVRLRMEQGTDTAYETLLIPFSHPPTVSLARPADQLTLTDVAFDAVASDPIDNDSIVAYRWRTTIGSTTAEFDGGAVPQYVRQFPVPGNHGVSVTAVDGYGATAEATVTIAALNRAPTGAVSASAPGLAAGWVVRDEPAQLDASASADLDGAVTKWRWDLNGDGACETSESTSATRQHSFSSDTVLGVCVKDDFGGTGTIATTQVRVTRRPVAAIGAPATVKPGAAATLSASGSTDPDGDTMAFAWDLDLDGAYNDATGPAASRSWPTEGTKTVGLRVTDQRGATATTTKDVVVFNAAPTPALTLSAGSVTVGAAVVLDARGSSDPDGTIVGYAFDLDGDNQYETPSATGVASRAYPFPATVSVGVQVTDSDNKKATKRVTLQVVAAPVPPPTGTGTTGTTGTTGGTGTPTTGGTGTGTGTAPSAPAPTGPPAASLGGPAIQRLKDVLLRGVALTCTADRTVTCTLKATVDKATAKRLGLARSPKGAVQVGTATVKGGSLRVRLSATAKRRLKGLRTALVAVTGTAKDAAGRATTVRRAVLVRR